MLKAVGERNAGKPPVAFDGVFSITTDPYSIPLYAARFRVRVLSIAANKISAGKGHRIDQTQWEIFNEENVP